MIRLSVSGKELANLFFAVYFYHGRENLSLGKEFESGHVWKVVAEMWSFIEVLRCVSLGNRRMKKKKKLGFKRD